MMTNIATQSKETGHEVNVLADGSKSQCLSFDHQQKFEIKRFDQIKFFRNKIKSSFANDLLKRKKFDLIFFDSWKSLEYFNNTTKIKKICIRHGNEIINHKKKDLKVNTLIKADKIIFNSKCTQYLFYKQLPEHNDLRCQVILPAFVQNTRHSHNKKK